MSDAYAGWRTGFSRDFRLFARLLGEDPTLSVPYGIVSGALLWGARERPDLLEQVCGRGPLTTAAAALRDVAPLLLAASLSRSARTDEALRHQLDLLLEHFREDCLRLGLLGGIDVSGHVEGVNVIIGGAQYVAGDLILTQNRPPAWTRPAAPNPPPHFVGRERELARIREVLRAGGSVAVTGLQGMGGIGKTALALKAATEPEFGAVLWASLGPAPSAVTHLLAWARHADPDFDADDGPPEVLVDRVRSALTRLVAEHCPGPVLVVLDDVWEGESTQVARLLQRAAPAGAAHLITTRSQLVVAQLRSTRLEVRPLEPADAVRMLRNLLAGEPDLAEHHLRDLAEVVGFHPLALELAAGQVQLQERPATEIVDLIAELRGGIPAGSPFRRIRLELGESREDSLETVLSLSYARLRPEDQARFRALGVFAYGVDFDRALCRAVWDDDDPRPGLDRLRHRALLTVAPQEGWYQQHQLLRAYARALLVSSSEPEGVRERYTRFVLGVADGFTALPPHGWGDLDPYIPHVEEVGGFDLPDQDALDLALRTRVLLRTRRELAHPEWLERGLEVSRSRLDLGHTALLLAELGQERAFRSDAISATRLLREALEIAEQTGDTSGMARIQEELGALLMHSDPDSACRYTDLAIELYEDLGDPSGLARAVLLMADWQAFGHRPFAERERAAALLDQAEEALQRAGRPTTEVVLRRGRLHDTLGEREKAIALLGEAVTQFRDQARRDREGMALLLLASALANADRMSEARERLPEAISLLTATGPAAAVATAWRNLGEAHLYAGDHRAALDCFAEALPLVPGVSMRFLNEDATADGVAPARFGAQVEDVAKLAHVEQFRQRSDLQKESGPLQELPDDVLHHLITGTLAPPAGWSQALDAFADRLAAHGARFAEAVEFVRALAGTGPRPRTGRFVEFLPVIDHRRSFDKLLYPPEKAALFATNTLAVVLSAPDRHDEWATALRQARRDARLWGDVAEERYLDALLGVLAGRCASLPESNPYAPCLVGVLNKLSDHIRLPAEDLVERAVAARVAVPEAGAPLLDELGEVRLEAVRHGADDETAFADELIALVGGEPPAAPYSGPYRELLDAAAAAVADGRQIMVPLPATMADALVVLTVTAMTRSPKARDRAIRGLTDMARDARRGGRFDEADLHHALAALLDGRPVDTEIYYGRVVEMARDLARTQEPTPPADDLLPEAEVRRLVEATVGALTSAPETRAPLGAELSAYRRALGERGPGWETEAALADALIAELTPSGPTAQAALPQGHPYAAAVARVRSDRAAYARIRAAGGILTPGELRDLVEETGRQVKEVVDFTAETMSAAMENGPEAMADGMSALNLRVLEQARWQDHLRRLRREYRREARHLEVELCAALISIVDQQPFRIDDAGPYAGPVREMTERIGFRLSMPLDTELAALSLDEESHTRAFRDTLSGRGRFVSALPSLIGSVVAAATFLSTDAPRMERVLERTAADLRARDQLPLEDEADLLNALLTLVRGGSPQLPPGHTYGHVLARTV
ncbi:NB-ARC domain-containing protein [Streptomyces sp. R28]|uniref:NB-ARC domain-containing protein n=1 Tax=Streptomyces sp. R28 TaxID=3238628 RepID=A0AB39PV08_9ACTN